MSYQLKIPPHIEEYYKTLPPKDLGIVQSALNLITETPFPFSYPGKIKALVGPLKGYFRCKTGRWRIVYAIDSQQKTIDVVKIALRDDKTYK